MEHVKHLEEISKRLYKLDVKDYDRLPAWVRECGVDFARIAHRVRLFCDTCVEGRTSHLFQNGDSEDGDGVPDTKSIVRAMSKRVRSVALSSGGVHRQLQRQHIEEVVRESDVPMPHFTGTDGFLPQVHDSVRKNSDNNYMHTAELLYYASLGATGADGNASGWARILGNAAFLYAEWRRLLGEIIFADGKPLLCRVTKMSSPGQNELEGPVQSWKIVDAGLRNAVMKASLTGIRCRSQYEIATAVVPACAQPRVAGKYVSIIDMHRLTRLGSGSKKGDSKRKEKGSKRPSRGSGSGGKVEAVHAGVMQGTWSGLNRVANGNSVAFLRFDRSDNEHFEPFELALNMRVQNEVYQLIAHKRLEHTVVDIHDVDIFNRGERMQRLATSSRVWKDIVAQACSWNCNGMQLLMFGRRADTGQDAKQSNGNTGSEGWWVATKVGGNGYSRTAGNGRSHNGRNEFIESCSAAGSKLGRVLDLAGHLYHESMEGARRYAGPKPLRFMQHLIQTALSGLAHMAHLQTVMLEAFRVPTIECARNFVAHNAYTCQRHTFGGGCPRSLGHTMTPPSLMFWVPYRCCRKHVTICNSTLSRLPGSTRVEIDFSLVPYMKAVHRVATRGLQGMELRIEDSKATKSKRVGRALKESFALTTQLLDEFNARYTSGQMMSPKKSHVLLQYMQELNETFTCECVAFDMKGLR